MIEPITAAIGIGVAGIGMFKQAKAQKKYAAASKKATQAMIDAERLREQQMELEGMRRQREIIRQMQAAQSLSVATFAGSGASMSGSSALPGALGQSRAQGNRQQNDVFQNLQIGRALFDANERKLVAESQMSKYQGQAATFGGLASLGGDIFKSAPQVASIGKSAFGI